MAAPTTSLGNVTVRKLNSVIASLWTKIKNTFAPKDDGQQTHDTTKFYRADGSWAVPTGDLDSVLLTSSDDLDNIHPDDFAVYRWRTTSIPTHAPYGSSGDATMHVLPIGDECCLQFVATCKISNNGIMLEMYRKRYKDGNNYAWTTWYYTDTTYPKAVKNITRSGTTFTATCYDGSTFTFDQQDTTYSQISRGSGAGLAPGLPSGSGTTKYLREDGSWQVPPDNNTTYSAGSGLSLSGTTFSLKTGYTTSGKNYKVQLDSSGNPYVNVPWTDTNTWRGIQNNLTSDSTTDSLSAAMGKELAAMVSAKVPLSGASTIQGQFQINPDSNANNYSEGIRLNKAPNGWTCLMIGSNRNTSNGAPETNGGWFVGCNTNEQFVVGNKDSSTNNAAMWIDTNRKVYFPSGINGYSQTSHTHSVKINGSTKTVAASGGTAVDLGYMLEILQTSAGSSAAYNLNTMTSSGVYFMNINASSSTGAPGNGRYTVIVLNAGSYVTQLAFGYYFRIRVNTGSEWKNWVTIAEPGK